jgi:nitrite reductase/ring-hydroxylating ferredoxin subunit/uncharacterized membrane protein
MMSRFFIFLFFSFIILKTTFQRHIMRSKAHFKSHPIHPLLIAFPIAFFTGTLVFDVLAWVLERTDLQVVAYFAELAGMLGAAAAAVPGIIDYLYTVPPESSAKKRATQHGLLNVTVLVLFAVAWFYRRDNADVSVPVLLGLEAVGFGLMMVGGWLGGTLVYRNQIAVDPRYADAGKWKEQHIKNPTFPIAVASVTELKPNQMKLLVIDGRRIVLARTEDNHVAFDDRCPHRGGSLAGGSMMCGTVQCPWHGSQFRVSDGTVTAGPAKEKIATYQVAERDGKVMLLNI